MEKIEIPVTRLPGNEDIPLPRYITGQAAGMDIFAAVRDEETIFAGERKVIPSGIAIALPEGFEAEIRPRSGLAVRYGVTVINSPGTIDADYRGEILILLINHGQEPFVVKRGNRIAQMVVHRVCRVAWSLCDELDCTQRGVGGLGHTG
jgi:dUTP pyrophosphatase